ncbi:unnamed protein product [Blepharisma stoltei]|uniref:Protein kinase domain-containing protein n=1 Tax=Blepharisma stoltei TaxID=1481888 RepID=A0AAU9K6P3_9CILI|nr:unnamed protein product [Blepharisma stoltei]
MPHSPAEITNEFEVVDDINFGFFGVVYKVRRIGNRYLADNKDLCSENGCKKSMEMLRAEKMWKQKLKFFLTPLSHFLFSYDPHTSLIANRHFSMEDTSMAELQVKN